MNALINDREQKFKLIYQSHVDEIYQYIYLRTGLIHTLAEDITQDIFLNVYKGLDGFKGLCSERTWIFRIAKNKLNDFYRKQYSKEFEFIEIDNQLIDQMDDPSQDIEEVMIKSFEKEKVYICLNNLIDQYKIVLVLKYIDEKSVKEIAHILSKSPKAIESVLQRAKKAFMKSYLQYDEKEGVQ